MSITLNQLIDQVREDLLSHREAYTKEAMYPFLFLEEIEIEVRVAVSTAVGASGKVNIEVIEFGGEASKTNEESHVIKVKLTPFFGKEEMRLHLARELGPHVMDSILGITTIAAA